MYMNARIAIGIISNQADTWREGLKDEMRSDDARRVAEFIAAQQQEIERLRKMHERNVINNCDVIRRALIVGLGYPDTVDGKCGGYAMSETDDEPHDSCKNCLAGVDSEEAWEAATHD